MRFDDDFNKLKKELVALTGYPDFDRIFSMPSSMCHSYFKTNVEDYNDKYIIRSEIPGVNKEDIKIDLKNNCFTITVTRNILANDADEKVHYLLREISGKETLTRSFELDNINSEGIKAEYVNGMLNVTIPKKEPEEQVKSIEIK